jgi:hypothetical protein
MATPAVGEDIEALCGRCGQVWHVVMAKMGDRIAKVVCKRCGGHHRYRTDDDAGDSDGERGGARRPSGVARRASRPQAPLAPPVVMPEVDPSKPVRPYAASAAYLPGERVAHPTFGSGVVTTLPGPGKVEIAFPAGMRVLACAKAASTLARPVAAANVPISDRPPK